MLSTLVDAAAVLMIASCIIPVLTRLLFLQAIKAAMNADIPTRYLALPDPPTTKDRQRLEEAKKRRIPAPKHKHDLYWYGEESIALRAGFFIL